MRKAFLFISVFVLFSCTMKEDNNPQKIMLADNDWLVQSSEKLNISGSEISTTGIAIDDWYDGFVPSTIMGVLTTNKQYAGILEGLNYKDIDRTPFDHSWWYRKVFPMPTLGKEQHAKLCFDGISYSANVWLNGTQIVSRNEFYGPFRQHTFDITPYLKESNVLAVEIFRAQPGDPNIGFVDWNPRPADESMGIFREVYVEVVGNVDIQHPYIHSKVNNETLEEAWLTVETTLKNNSDKKVKGRLVGSFDGKSFGIPVTLEGKEAKKMVITSKEAPELHMIEPRLWWCNNLGDAEMYTLNLRFEEGKYASDEESVPFGIREIKDYFTENGDRGFILNGKKVLVKSAGWTDDIFLRDTPATNEIQVRYVKDMNMNSIRFENVWGTSQNIYDLCDKHGLLALVGWSCQWEWENYLGSPVDEYGGIIAEKDMDLIAQSLKDQILWLRNHPSIIAWYVGSDMIPRPALEERYMKVLQEVDQLRPYVAAAAKITSEITGPTGMKMHGPYEYVGPNYWYEDTKYGGAYGFNTETGIGAQLPVIESLKRMIPEDKLWPINEYWNYHCTTSTTEMNSLKVLTETIEKKYGKATNLEDYLRKADLLNYEGTKAMFEAFRVNIPQTTGIVQWMLNSAWPSLYWQLYDYYFIPTSAYYGVKKANQKQQLIYNYKDNAVYYVNEVLTPVERKAKIAMYDAKSVLLHEAEFDFRVEADYSKKIFELDKIAGTVFLSLQLFDKEDKLIARNFYCLSGKKDEYAWDKTNWVRTPMTAYADFKALNSLPAASLMIDGSASSYGENKLLKIEIANEKSVLSFMTRFVLKDNDGNVVYPVFWEDNYFEVLPGERRTLNCTIPSSLIDRDGLRLYASGWNLHETEIVIFW